MARNPVAVWTLRILVLTLGVVAMIACGSSSSDLENGAPNGGDPGGAGATTGPTSVQARSGLPCAVDRIFREHCQTCHGDHPAAGATASLVMYSDLQADLGGKKVFQLVGERVQAHTMPPSPNKLSDEEIATLTGWIGQGAPSINDTCDLGAAGTSVKPLSCKPDLILKSPKPITMPTPAPSDVYQCFGATVNLEKKRHIIAFAPHVDNAKILHHILIFKSPTPVGTDPFPCSAAGSAAWQLVAGWAPGGENFELPPEAGFPENVGPTNWVMQVHYNTAGGKWAGQSDQSGFEMCTTETLRPNDADVAGFGTIHIAIPPRSKLTDTCTLVADALWEGKTFFSGSSHMHTHGSALTTQRFPVSGGSPEMIFATDNFDFNNQLTVPIKPVQIHMGDTIQTKCSWKNSSDSLITFGEDTANEMCFNFLAYYPAIPGYNWTAPALLPCIPEVGAAE